MKTISGLTIILLFLLAPLSSGLSFQNEPCSFRGVIWGEFNYNLPRQPHQVSQEGDFLLVSREGDMAHYIRKNENLVLGEVPLEAVYYIFYKNRLFRAILKYDGTYYDLLERYLTQVYGLGDRSMHKHRTWWWTGCQVYVGLTSYIYLPGGMVSFTYWPLHNEIQEDNAEAARDGLDPFYDLRPLKPINQPRLNTPKPYYYRIEP